MSLWCSSRGSFVFSALVFEEEDAYPRECQSFKTLRLRSTQEASPANFAFTAFSEIRAVPVPHWVEGASDPR